MFQNVEHLEELIKVINKTPKKLSELNDISRIKDLYTANGANGEKLPKFVRQNIFISKFRNLDLDYVLDSYCSSNVYGSIKLNRVHSNLALDMAKESNGHLKLTLRRLPNVATLEHADDARFSFFTK